MWFRTKRLLVIIRNNLLQLLAMLLYGNKPIADKIVFDNFLGKGFGENPKYIAEQLFTINPNLDMVWVCKNKSEWFPDYVRVVKYGSLESLKEYYTAKVWIDNVRNSFKPIIKKEGQLYLQTWHGLLAFKHIEGQIDSINPYYKKQAIRDGKMCDAILSPNSEMTSIMSNSFWLQDCSKVLLSGSPESDIFFSLSLKEDANKTIRKNYGIDSETTIILYMPTFRDGISANAYNLDYHLLHNTIEKKVENDCVLLIRMHPNVKDSNRNDYSEKVIDVSEYPDANELLCVADWLISDYSSVIYVSVLLRKPAFLYIPDIEEYKLKRGLNPCYEQLPCPKSLSYDSLVSSINEFDYASYRSLCKQYENHVSAYNKGTSSRFVANWINKQI